MALRMRRRKKKMRRHSTPAADLSVNNANAAGIDIGSEQHFVAVPIGRDPGGDVRCFGCFTTDLCEMADWLRACGVTTVAMESTGVYWIPVYQLLEARGFEVNLVNARHLKNVPGRKSDVQDCQWIQRLHSYGLLSGSFRPNNEICILRSYLRQRDNLVKSASTHILRMQKALTEMNVQLHKVISDITGKTGLAIIEAILNGQRDPMTLAQLKDPRVKSSTERIAKALQGDYRSEHLFTLRQELEVYRFYRDKICECDRQISVHLASLESSTEGDDVHHSYGAPSTSPPAASPTSSAPSTTTLRQELIRISGVDFTTVPGFEVTTVQKIISEVGLDPRRWPSEKHFSSGLGLCPGNTVTGGKVKSSRTRRVKSRAAEAFRLAAQSLKRSQTALGAFFRRMRARLGAPEAITATAHKLARIFYSMLKNGQHYVELGMKNYDEKYHLRLLANLQRRARDLGYELVENQTVTL